MHAFMQYNDFFICQYIIFMRFFSVLNQLSLFCYPALEAQNVFAMVFKLYQSARPKDLGLQTLLSFYLHMMLDAQSSHAQVSGEQGSTDLSMAESNDTLRRLLLTKPKEFLSVAELFKLFLNQLRARGINTNGFKLSYKNGNLCITIPTKNELQQFLKILSTKSTKIAPSIGGTKINGEDLQKLISPREELNADAQLEPSKKLRPGR